MSFLLDVRDLRVAFPGQLGTVRAVDGASFRVGPGERVGLAGESGAGKTVTGLGIMGLVRCPPARVTGTVRFAGRDVLSLGARERRRLRGSRIAMVLQNPFSSLNPAMTVGSQVAEAIRVHRGLSRRQARGEAVERLLRVGLPDAERNADQYPHRFSGGMRQRVMIAMALSGDPDLLIADEPTTALDVTVQAQIVDLLVSLSHERGMAVLLITHDLAVLARFAERLVVMYAGRVMEEGPVETLYYNASHPYTWGLMASTTRLDEARRERLQPIAGNPPSAVLIPPGCPFHPRCPHARERCRREVPRLVCREGEDHPAACHFAGQLGAPPIASEARR